MAVRYIVVNAKSELFSPASRSFGNIAIVGKSTSATIAVNTPQTFTNPTDAKTAFPGDLGNAVERAFLQTPPPMTIFGVRVDTAAPNWANALIEVAKLDAQIVCLANTSLTATSAAAEILALATHVTSVSNTGGDGKERIGVAMLAKDSTTTTVVTTALVNERMVYVAHRSSDDVAAAVAGVIAGYEPHISVLLKPVNVSMDNTFSDAEIDAFNAASINWLTDPVLLPGRGIYMGESYTGDPSPTKGKQYVDIVRTLDDVSFRLKANLIRAIGNLRVTRAGIRSVIAIIQATMSPLQAREVIDNYNVYSPLLVLLDKDPDKLSASEGLQITQAHASRRVDLAVTVGYAGAIHRLVIDLIFK
jgi:hypothetical protein